MRHTQVRLTASDGHEAVVDEGIASLIGALWQSGIETVGSCQDQDGIGMAWVSFTSHGDAARFVRIAGRGAENLAIREEDRDPDSPWDSAVAGIAFPANRIHEVERRVRADSTLRRMP